MPITVTITKQNVFDEYGRGPLIVGQQYTPISDNYAISLVQTLKATDTNGVLGQATPIAGPRAILWGSRPSVTGLVGYKLRFTDVGAGNPLMTGGSEFSATQNRWRPVNGQCLLDAIDTPNAAIANTTEQQLNPNHVAVPAGLLIDGDRLMLYLSLSKSGTSDSCTIRVKYGPLGTVADPTIMSITSMAATNQTYGGLLEFKRISATQIQKQGNGDPSLSFSGGSTGAFPAAVTVSNMDTNAMYLSVTSQMTNGTEVATLNDMILDFRATDT